MVRTLEGTTEEVRLQYRSLERISSAPGLAFGGATGTRPGPGSAPAALAPALPGCAPGAAEAGSGGALGKQRAPSPTQGPGPGSLKGSPSVHHKPAAAARSSMSPGAGQDRSAGPPMCPPSGAAAGWEGSASLGPLPSLSAAAARPRNASSPASLKGQGPGPGGTGTRGETGTRAEAGAGGAGAVRELHFGPEGGPGGKSLSSQRSAAVFAPPVAPEGAAQGSVGGSPVGPRARAADAGNGDWVLVPSPEQPSAITGSASTLRSLGAPAPALISSLLPLQEAARSTNPSTLPDTDPGRPGPCVASRHNAPAQRPGASLRMRLQAVADGEPYLGCSPTGLLGRSQADTTSASPVPATHSSPAAQRGSKRLAASALGPLEEIPRPYRGDQGHIRGPMALSEGARESQPVEHSCGPAQSLAASFQYDTGANATCLPSPGDPVSPGLLPNQGPGLLSNQGTGLLTTLVSWLWPALRP